MFTQGKMFDFSGSQAKILTINTLYGVLQLNETFVSAYYSTLHTVQWCMKSASWNGNIGKPKWRGLLILWKVLLTLMGGIFQWTTCGTLGWWDVRKGALQQRKRSIFMRSMMTRSYLEVGTILKKNTSAQEQSPIQRSDIVLLSRMTYSRVFAYVSRDYGIMPERWMNDFPLLTSSPSTHYLWLAMMQELIYPSCSSDFVYNTPQFVRFQENCIELLHSPLVATLYSICMSKNRPKARNNCCCCRAAARRAFMHH